MKSKKGFTLIELLSVIIIITVVAFLGYASVSAIREKIKKNMFEKDLEQILTAATDYGSDNKELISSSDDYLTINAKSREFIVVTLGDLINEDYDKTDDVILFDKLSTAQQKLCKKPTADSSDEMSNYCYSVNHYKDGTSINDLKIILYKSNSSGRVKACIPTEINDASFASNSSILQDDNQKEYKDLNVYCANYHLTSTVKQTKVKLSLDATGWTNYAKTVNLSAYNDELELTEYSVGLDLDCSTATYQSLDNVHTKNDTFVVGPVGSKSKTGANAQYTYTDQDTTFVACVKDSDDNLISDTITIDKIDINPPTCSVSNNNNWSNNTSISLQCSDTGSGCKNGNSQTYVIPPEQINYENNTYSFNVSDKAGNTGSCTATLKIDSSPPYYNPGQTRFKRNSSRDIIDQLVNLHNIYWWDIFSLFGSDSGDIYNPECDKENGICYAEFCTSYLANFNDLQFTVDAFQAMLDKGSGYDKIIKDEYLFDKNCNLTVKKKRTFFGFWDWGQYNCSISQKPCVYDIVYYGVDKAGNEEKAGELILTYDYGSCVWFSKNNDICRTKE